jgi:hypothetical protein
VSDGAAAAELRAAIDADAAHDGNRRTSQDTPEINTLEGHVSLSLKTARTNHERAREVDPTIEAVSVPDSLRRAMGLKAKAKPAKAAAPPDGAPPVTPLAARTKRARRSKRG